MLAAADLAGHKIAPCPVLVTLFLYTTHYTSLHYTTLHHTTLHYTTLPYSSTLLYSLHYTTLQCNTIHQREVRYSTIQSIQTRTHGKSAHISPSSVRLYRKAVDQIRTIFLRPECVQFMTCPPPLPPYLRLLSDIPPPSGLLWKSIDSASYSATLIFAWRPASDTGCWAPMATGSRLS